MKRIPFLIAILVFAASLHAQMMGGKQPGMRDDKTPAMSHQTLVAPDGTAFLVRRGSQNLEIVAVRATGTIAWTAPLDKGMTDLMLTGNLLVTSTPSVDSEPRGVQSRLTGISIVSGAKQWTLDLNGIVMEMTPFAGGTYVMLVKQGTRSLLAVGSDGKVLWTLPLDV